ncbi:PKD-like family lipoprotein [Sphingobacterium humi]|uniref:DUF4374 domain-containing protein n=1 Tax=Sphingobacterium humi TaxID=1796905 RepID=A0A6N8KWJ6_9SPHI|nr:PKD-like family lipoprotein [Sphingobacterium humi]MVZ61775.1 hypothetical protein [Sphingobacterium humi]
MKTLKYILFILIIGLLSACSKDLGNYDYKDVNEIIIGGLKEGDHNTDRIYDLAFRDTLILNPTFHATIEGADISDLTYSWKVKGEVVSEKKDFFYIANKDYGRLNAEFVVTNQKTGLKSNYNFFVNVINPYKLGYYVLAKDASNNSLLYCKSSIRVKPQFEEVKLPNIDLGKNPVNIGGTRQYGSSSTDYFNNLVIGVQHAEYPVIMIDSREFIPSLLYNSKSFVGDQTNFAFEPTDVIMDKYSTVIYTVSGGKMYVLQDGAIGLPALYNDAKDYQIPKGGLGGNNNNSRYFFSFYDAKNKQIRLIDIGALSNVPYNFTVSNDQLTDPAKYPNQTFVASQLASISSAIKFVYLMREGNNLFAYMSGYSSDYKANSFDRIATGTIPGDGTIGFAYFETGDNFWYLANEKTVYRASYLGLEFQKYFSLPSDAPGHITKYKKANGKLMVATYDPSFAGAKKGSVYIFNEATMQLEQALPHSVEEVVDIHVGN